MSLDSFTDSLRKILLGARYGKKDERLTFYILFAPFEIKHNRD